MTIQHLRSLGAAAVVFASAFSAAGAAQAHHSFATEFDSKKNVAVEGIVTKAQFVNPHAWLYLDVKNPDGTTTNWGFEFGTPMSLKRNNVTKENVHAGSHVRIEGYRAKNGGAFGYCAVLTLDDGRKVRLGGAPDAPTAPAAG